MSQLSTAITSFDSSSSSIKTSESCLPDCQDMAARMSALVNTRKQINSAYRSVNPFCISLFFHLHFFYDSVFYSCAPSTFKVHLARLLFSPCYRSWPPFDVVLLLLLLLVAAFNDNPYKHTKRVRKWKKKAQRNVTQEIKLWRTLAALRMGPLVLRSVGRGCPFALLWCHRSLLFLLFDNYRTAHKSTLALVSANKMKWNIHNGGATKDHSGLC